MWSQGPLECSYRSCIIPKRCLSPPQSHRERQPLITVTLWYINQRVPQASEGSTYLRVTRSVTLTDRDDEARGCNTEEDLVFHQFSGGKALSTSHTHTGDRLNREAHQRDPFTEAVMECTINALYTRRSSSNVLYFNNSGQYSKSSSEGLSDPRLTPNSRLGVKSCTKLILPDSPPRLSPVQGGAHRSVFAKLNQSYNQPTTGGQERGENLARLDPWSSGVGKLSPWRSSERRVLRLAGLGWDREHG
ncbi:hypothetical protein JOB18_006760 [Solea senegalensis]|uniref:Uncharacterized protein n=1 Tax=Solea senegalensis TaxID=28829 RepID=A0AAV6RK34_SOLSE|nr:hypothetical protein JOB18_006760 [Solea senegalensis]